MKRFWDTLIEPILDAARPKSIVEVGSDTGANTRNLLTFCEKNDGVLHVVDPEPKYDVLEWRERYGDRFDFHRALSLEAIPRIDNFDLLLLDGDHNWYTVYNELKLIERLCEERSQPFPLVMLHDIGWPYERRDLYYDPAAIPEAYRQPHSKRGTRPGQTELLEEGGLNRQFHKAVHEGGPRNGVLTAIEDFLEETGQPVELIKVPGFHKIGILLTPQVRENVKLSKVLETWDLPAPVARHIEKIEETWLETEIRRQDSQERLKKLRSHLDEKVRNLRTKQERTKRDMQSVIGIITRVDIENRRFVMVPEKKEDRTKENRTLFRFNKSLEVTVDGKDAEPKDLQKRQHAKIEYMMRKGKEIALSVDVQSEPKKNK